MIPSETVIAKHTLRCCDYPRVLLVNGQAIGQKSGVGSTLANLFRGWPHNRIAQIVPVFPPAAPSICLRNWILDAIDDADGPGGNGGVINAAVRKIRSARGYRLSDDILLWVEKFNPQLIYSYLELPLITNLAVRIAKHLSVPIIPHLMDEWHVLSGKKRLSERWWHIRQQIDFKKIIKQAPFGLAISDAMSVEYKKRFMRPFFTFMNSADPDIYTPMRQQTAQNSFILRMIYTGSGPGLGRWPIIENIGKAVQELNRNGYQIEFAAFVRKDLFEELPEQGDGFTIHDFIEEKSLASYLSTCDIAILAEGFDQKSIQYTRLSFSSKIPIYLMAGCYLLAVGPSQNNSIKYVNVNHLGRVIHDMAVTVLGGELKELYQNWHVLQETKARNRDFALVNHSQPETHKKLCALLSGVAQ